MATLPGTFIANAGCDTLANITLSFYDEINTEVTFADATLTALAEGAEYQWLDCDAGFETIPEQTAQSFTPDATGNYAVEITENGMCTDTSACYYVLVSNVFEKTTETIAVYPNPANDVLTVDLNHNNGGNLKVADFTGKIIINTTFQGSKFTLDISQFPSGIYSLNIQAGEKSLNKKIIKY